MKSRIVALVISLSLVACGGTGSGSGAGGGSAGTGGGKAGGAGGGTAGGAGGGTAGGAGGGTAGTVDAGPACAGMNGATCNNLVQVGGLVNELRSSATVPVAMGGVVTPGTYYLTTVTEFVSDGGTGPTGKQRQETWLISATTLQTVARDSSSDGGCTQNRASGTLKFDGGIGVAYAPTCPVCDGGTNCDRGGSAGYTATATTFNVIIPQGDRTQVMTLTKQ